MTKDTFIKTILSPLIAKVYYLDITVEEKIIVDDSFELRDLIYSKKQMHKYLLIELSSKWTKIYLGNSDQFVKVISNIQQHTSACINDASWGGSTPEDKRKEKEILLNRFLRHTDIGLTLLLKAYNLPVFVMGNSRTIGHFKLITHNEKHVVEYIH